MVPQTTFLFACNVKENIAFGKEMPEAEIIAAAKMACIYDEIMEFPDGFDTELGEKGFTISGGQRQRIAIARAIAIQPQFIILDDALSAIDTNTERTIWKNLESFLKERTSIIITHKISSVQNSDRIFVLDNGRLVEEGIHNELLKVKGIYYQLYERQKLEDSIGIN